MRVMRVVACDKKEAARARESVDRMRAAVRSSPVVKLLFFQHYLLCRERNRAAANAVYSPAVFSLSSKHFKRYMSLYVDKNIIIMRRIIIMPPFCAMPARARKRGARARVRVRKRRGVACLPSFARAQRSAQLTFARKIKMMMILCAARARAFCAGAALCLRKNAAKARNVALYQFAHYPQAKLRTHGAE